MIDEKRERGAVSAAPDEAAGEGKVIDLMAALKKSLARDKAPTIKPKRATRARKRAGG